MVNNLFAIKATHANIFIKIGLDYWDIILRLWVPVSKTPVGKKADSVIWGFRTNRATHGESVRASSSPWWSTLVLGRPYRFVLEKKH